MPFPPAVFSAISTALNLAWFIYDKGIRSTYIPHDQDYVQLVNAVGEFHSSLKSISDVLIRANQEVVRHHVEGHLSYGDSLESFRTIVGDFQTTLEDCQRLLDAKESYARGQVGLWARMGWNVTAKEEVHELRDRIAFHHTRLNQTLQPLKISLTLSLRDLLQGGFQDVRSGQAEILREIARTQEHLGLNPRVPVTAEVLAPPVFPLIPGYLRARFDVQADVESDLPVSDEVRISSIMGHLTDVPPIEIGTAVPRETIVRRYVNLMKAVWILQRPSQVLAENTQSGSSLTTVMCSDLSRQVLDGLVQYDEPRGTLSKPTTDELSALSKIHFALWLFQPGSRPLKTRAINTNEVLLLEVPLETATATRRQQLMVIGSLTMKHKLKLVTSFVDSVGRSNNPETETVDTRRVVLQPTYAQLDAQLYNIQLRASAEDNDAVYQFRQLGHVLRFQHCLTGFEVKHDSPGLAELKYKHGGLKKVKRMEVLSDGHDTARAQIWYHKPMREAIKLGSENAASQGNLLSPSRLSQAMNSSHSSRRKSHNSSTRSQTLSIDQWTQEHVSSSLVSSPTKSDAIVQEIPNLEEPKVVILLAVSQMSSPGLGEPKRVKRLQYFTFSLRHGVFIDPGSCKCRDGSSCNVLVIKSQGALNAHLYDHKHDLANWNLAALGQPEHKDSGKCVRTIEDLNRIMITFKDARERQLFGEALKKTIALYEQQREKLDKQIDKVRYEDVVR